MIFNFSVWDPSHPLRVAILSNLPQELRKMVEYEPGNDLGSWKISFDGFVHITCILQAFSGLSSLPQGLFFWPKGASQDFWTCICQVLCIFIDFGVPGVPYCDF